MFIGMSLTNEIPDVGVSQLGLRIFILTSVDTEKCPMEAVLVNPSFHEEIWRALLDPCCKSRFALLWCRCPLRKGRLHFIRTITRTRYKSTQVPLRQRGMNFSSILLLFSRPHQAFHEDPEPQGRQQIQNERMCTKKGANQPKLLPVRANLSLEHCQKQRTLKVKQSGDILLDMNDKMTGSNPCVFLHRLKSVALRPPTNF
ncbi:uncharacterized protein CIMG_13084 [Coccidioides immitis RS]|uniref:Uncharacterized protein n=1 Tax=Coccidioides immitis (strain RS) TaxID=246410 RepID=A0A0E1RW87_COCIM|nr:uncharacterized protein CIMG_13084 [Coccidioides immitis RS]EAS31329.2 hypothetical protein CIMG_13084 [Coccidioides immitis RS]